MLKTASLIVAGVITLGYGTAALAQTHYDPTPEHIYYYGPAEPVANTTPAATTNGRAARAQAGHTTQNSHAQQHAMPASHHPATQKPAPQG